MTQEIRSKQPMSGRNTVRPVTHPDTDTTQEIRSKQLMSGGGNSVGLGVKAVQYDSKVKRRKNNHTYRNLMIMTVILITFLVAVIASGGGGGKGGGASIDDINECRLKTDNNCSSTERCENTASSFRCIPCPEHSVRAANGLKCNLECPLDYVPSKNGETCLIECRPNYVMTSDGLHCKADVCALTGQLIGEQKINNLEGGLRHGILAGDHFGASVARWGDVDGNGVVDIAVGSSHRNTPKLPSNVGFGSVTTIFLNADHTVLSNTRIGTAMNGREPVGGLANPIGQYDYFGASLDCLGDLDGDGVPDLIVGAPGDDDGGVNEGALYVLFMLPTGAVKMQHKISRTAGGLIGIDLPNRAMLGLTLSVVGEVDRENGVVGVVVVTYPFKRNNVIYFMELNLDGTVKRAYQLLEIERSPWEGDVRWTWVGGIAEVGDVDGNGVVDLVIGQPTSTIQDDGRVVVLRMSSGNDDEQGILAKQMTTTSMLGWEDLRRNRFGSSIAGVGDLDGDGTPDVAVGAVDHYRNAVHLLLLNPDGSVKGWNIIDNLEGGVVEARVVAGVFGAAIATLVERGDSEKGVVTLVVGVSRDEATVKDGGAVYIMKVPPGFVEVCPGKNEECINCNDGENEACTGDDTYTCG